MKNAPPVPQNEWERIIKLSEFDLDYSDRKEALGDLTRLAAKVAGTEISLINLIDSFTQWSISDYGLPLEQMRREDSVCQYTIIAKEEKFEVQDLSADDRFKDKFYVAGYPNLRYYFGVPLQTNDGYNLGALCVLDTIGKEITPEKVELLKIIASEIVNRLTAIKVIENLRNKIKESTEAQKKVAHDIRGPLGGIIGLAQIISEQGDSNKMDEVLEFIDLIQKSGNSLLELANEILSTEKKSNGKTEEPRDNVFNLSIFKDKLERLYTPQAIHKHIDFSVYINSGSEAVPFSRNKLLQITGNLISNAMKFTPENGKIGVGLELASGKMQNNLTITVTDSGVGLDEKSISDILGGAASSTQGTGGEPGYGFGLALVKHLVNSLKGTMKIHSKPGEGASFEIQLPQPRLA
jgi:signal transduction histidine kinase